VTALRAYLLRTTAIRTVTFVQAQAMQRHVDRVIAAAA